MSILSHKPRTVQTHTITMASKTSVADAMIRITDFLTQICPRIFHAHHAWHAYVKHASAAASDNLASDRVFARLEPPSRYKDADWQSFLTEETAARTLAECVRALGYSTEQTHALPPGAYNYEHCAESTLRSCAPIPMLLVGFPNETARYTNADLHCVSALIDTALGAYEALCESPIGYAYWRHYYNITCLSESVGTLHISAQLYLLLKSAQRDSASPDTADLDALLQAARKRKMRVQVDKQRCSIAANRLVMSQPSAELAAQPHTHDVSGFGEVMWHDIYWCADDHPHYKELANTLYLELRLQLMCRDLIECYFQFLDWSSDSAQSVVTQAPPHFSWQQCCDSVRYIARNGYADCALTAVIARLQQNRGSDSVAELASWIDGRSGGRSRRKPNKRAKKKKANQRARTKKCERTRKDQSPKHYELEQDEPSRKQDQRRTEQQLDLEIEAFRQALAQTCESKSDRIKLNAACYESIVQRIAEIKSGN